jgi:hypothetical protein
MTLGRYDILSVLSCVRFEQNSVQGMCAKMYWVILSFVKNLHSYWGRNFYPYFPHFLSNFCEIMYKQFSHDAIVFALSENRRKKDCTFHVGVNGITCMPVPWIHVKMLT